MMGVEALILPVGMNTAPGGAPPQRVNELHEH